MIDIHTKLISHDITQEFLSANNLKFDGQCLDPAGLLSLACFDPPVEVSVLEFAHLFSVFNGSRAHLQAENQFNDDLLQPGQYVTVINRKVIEVQHKNKTGLFKETNGDTGLQINGIFISHFMLRKRNTPAMLGSIAFSLCAIQAFLLEVSKIELIAAGGEGFNPIFYGYKVWPKFGFNAEIEPNEFNADKAPQLAGCETVLDAVALDPLAWDEHGSQRVMTFDLAPSSRSWAQLIKYLRDHDF
ncbi:hypothetical protein N5D77_26530 [Comamonas thiooxydans]|uniref:Uncharacterized protein n=1 Tax=Comamonas thiooxydans TaxID=363952 RepID=A0AA42Q5H6_9BURK|nr:hypothetical protein [Comamonas thiooxydans]MDH1337618.1 hypothetical protein [Comamonas thiooxydans]MDH1743818.1 hypothetical protein [Comamonas thiooxydans]MDH1790110.1 hypothetical protein [Comamonas thiooxydans]